SHCVVVSMPDFFPTYTHNYSLLFLSNFLFTHASTPNIYTLSLHDALPISPRLIDGGATRLASSVRPSAIAHCPSSISFLGDRARSEEHTSELQSPYDLVCRLLLEKKNRKTYYMEFCNRIVLSTFSSLIDMT